MDSVKDLLNILLEDKADVYKGPAPVGNILNSAESNRKQRPAQVPRPAWRSVPRAPPATLPRRNMAPTFSPFQQRPFNIVNPFNHLLIQHLRLPNSHLAMQRCQHLSHSIHFHPPPRAVNMQQLDAPAYFANPKQSSARRHHMQQFASPLLDSRHPRTHRIPVNRCTSLNPHYNYYHQRPCYFSFNPIVKPNKRYPDFHEMARHAHESDPNIRNFHTTPDRIRVNSTSFTYTFKNNTKPYIDVSQILRACNNSYFAGFQREDGSHSLKIQKAAALQAMGIVATDNQQQSNPQRSPAVPSEGPSQPAAAPKISNTTEKKLTGDLMSDEQPTCSKNVNQNNRNLNKNNENSKKPQNGPKKNQNPKAREAEDQTDRSNTNNKKSGNKKRNKKNKKSKKNSNPQIKGKSITVEARSSNVCSKNSKKNNTNVSKKNDKNKVVGSAKKSADSTDKNKGASKHNSATGNLDPHKEPCCDQANVTINEFNYCRFLQHPYSRLFYDYYNYHYLNHYNKLMYYQQLVPNCRKRRPYVNLHNLNNECNTIFTMPHHLKSSPGKFRPCEPEKKIRERLLRQLRLKNYLAMQKRARNGRLGREEEEEIRFQASPVYLEGLVMVEMHKEKLAKQKQEGVLQPLMNLDEVQGLKENSQLPLQIMKNMLLPYFAELPEQLKRSLEPNRDKSPLVKRQGKVPRDGRETLSIFSASPRLARRIIQTELGPKLINPKEIQKSAIFKTKIDSFKKKQHSALSLKERTKDSNSGSRCHKRSRSV